MTNFRETAQRWLTVDNVSLLLGIGLLTVGASLWSARAALLTSGSLVTSITLLRFVLEGKRG
jgi:hypothetical protein